MANPFASAGGVFKAGSSGSKIASVSPLKAMRTEVAGKQFSGKGACIKKRKRERGDPPRDLLCVEDEEE